MIPPSSREFQGNRSCRVTYRSPIYRYQPTIGRNRLTPGFTGAARSTPKERNSHVARRLVQPLVGRCPTTPAVTTRPTLTWAATRRSAAATQRSCQGDMRYAPPHSTARRPLSRPALPHAPTAQAPALTLPQRERPPGTLAPSRAIGARAPAP